METVSVAEARRKLADIIIGAGLGGKRYIVQRHGKPLAAVVSMSDLRRLQQLEDPHSIEHQMAALAALDEAERVGELILKERNGEYLPDSADLIREMREERTDELLNLR